jgi:hypothetical protein
VDIEFLINRVKDLFVLIKVYSNYDCTNSYDTMQDSDYLKQVYKRVKKGVNKDDFMWEHMNGAYGGSLFCFLFRTDLSTLISLKDDFRKGKKVFIPKGTQFGFFSDYQGSGSPFEKETYQDMWLKIKENTKGYNSKYDNIDMIADIEQHYSMEDVYSPTREFAKEQKLINVK